MNVNLNPREQAFLQKLMKPWTSVAGKDSPLYWDFALKAISAQFDESALVTAKARAMLDSITSKIQFAYMDAELERILLEVEQVPTETPETTKSESFKRSVKNSSKGHLLIKAALSGGEAMSRTELANATNLRVSAVCARVKELIEEGVVRVAGKKWDKESQRKVETVELV
ncbi:hypothetical protein ACES2J_08280 [Bdellovibrio bacteriovorus]|uniref:hypothetical protein n=1 Tax=Bdellovibrio bacteriovorus TaxID=959 RepID=UPI0035A721EB